MLRTVQSGTTRVSTRILEALRERIQAGVYRPGDRLPAERELSREFFADRSSVRAALATLGQQGLIVRERGRRPWVRGAAAGDSSHVLSVKRLSTVKQTIAVVLPQHDADHASREILHGISQVLRQEQGAYRVLIFDTNLLDADRSHLEQDACRAIVEEGIAGAVVWPTLAPDFSVRWRDVADQGHPVVFVDRYESSSGLDFVGVDNYTGAKEAVEYLIALGHTRIVHVTNDEPVSAVVDRGLGYRDAMQTAGLVSRNPWVCPLPARDELAELFVRHCVSSPGSVSAVFTVNDGLAHRLIGRFEAHGVKVPEDLSVIGFDDVDRFSPRPVMLTTMRQPFDQIGRRAASLLVSRLSRPGSSKQFVEHVLLPATLVQRQTCKAHRNS